MLRVFKRKGIVLPNNHANKKILYQINIILAMLSVSVSHIQLALLLLQSWYANTQFYR